MAALCRLKIGMQYQDPTVSQEYQEINVLITDLPLFSARVPFRSSAFREIKTLEVFTEDQLIGTATPNQIPAAAFTSEGGFRGPDDFEWNIYVEEELHGKLSRLLE